MIWTPEEVAALLANRPNQPHYIADLIGKCVDEAVRAALAAAQPPAAQTDPIVEAWLLGRAVQYLVLGGHDDEWTDFSGGGKPNTGSKRLAWRLKPTAQPPAAMPESAQPARHPLDAPPHRTHRERGMSRDSGGPA